MQGMLQLFRKWPVALQAAWGAGLAILLYLAGQHCLNDHHNLHALVERSIAQDRAAAQAKQPAAPPAQTPAQAPDK